MSASRVLGRAAVAGLVVGYVGLATAADDPRPVAPAAPAVVAGEGCATCTAGPAGAPCRSATCKSCEGRHLGYKPPKPVVGQLRPGACFGYFQTQWHRWEDVCPLPYQGVGVSDAPQRIPSAAPVGIPPAGGAAPKGKGTDTPLPPPAVVPNPKGGLPPIPMTPPGK